MKSSSSAPPKSLKEAIEISRELQVIINEDLNYALDAYPDVRISERDAERAGLRYDAIVAEQTRLTTLEIKTYIVKTYHENPAVASWGPLLIAITTQQKDLHKILLNRYRVVVDRSIN